MINPWYFYIYLSLKRLITNTYELIKITKIYYKRKIAYICFFENQGTVKNNFEIRNKKQITNSIFLPKLYKITFLSQKKKFINFFFFIFDYLYVSNYSMLNSLSYTEKFISDSNIIRYSCINFNRYLKFNYWVHQIYLNSKYNNWKLNNLKSRIKNYTKANNLKGYKMYLSGRFRRKQRAAYYWFSKGKVPLNTLSAFIDYAYYTIPLKNSAITVKVWLYKSSSLSNLYYIKIY